MEEIETHIQYYKNGNINTEYHKLNGERHGLQKKYWHNGNLMYYYFCVNNQWKSTLQRWRENSNRCELIQYGLSDRHGPEIKFYYLFDSTSYNIGMQEDRHRGRW